MTEYLDYFAKTDGADAVSVGVITDTGLRGIVPLSDAALTAHAQGSNPSRAVWDETDICALANIIRRPTP